MAGSAGAGPGGPPTPARLGAGMAALAAAYVLSYLFRNVNGVLAPDLMHDLGLGAGALGLLTSAYFLTFTAAQLPIGVLLDRCGPRRVQPALLLCAASGAALCAAGRGFLPLLAGRALIGLGTAGALVAGLKASAQWFPRERLSLVNGGLIMCGGLGALAATWPVEAALRWLDWRGLFTALAALTLALAAVLHLAVPGNRPAAPAAPGGAPMRLRDVARDPLFRCFAPLSASCFGTVLAVQGLWAAPWFADVEALPRTAVAGRLALMAGALLVAAPCWGVLVQLLRPHVRLTSVAGWAAAALIGVEALILGRAGLGSPALPWCLFALFGGMTVLSYGVLADHFPPEALGRANGALNVLHIGASFLVQLGIGAIVGRWPSVAGHYPTGAYVAGLALPVALQVAALLWFAWPRAGARLAVQASPG